MGELVNKIKAIQPKIKVILISAFEINYLELKKAFPEIKVDSLISNFQTCIIEKPAKNN